MALMHRRRSIFPMERAPHGLHAALGGHGVLTAQACPETWRSPCLWRTDHAFQFFPVHLTVLSGKTKTKQFLDNDLKYSKTLHIFIFLSIWGKSWLNSWGILKCICVIQTRSSPNLPNIIGYQKWKWNCLSHVWFFVTLWPIQSMEFSRPEYWSEDPFPSIADLLNPGIKPGFPALQADFLLSEPPGKW